MDFVREGGWPMYPILACGVAAIVLAVRHALVPQRSLRPLVVGLAATAAVLGVFGTVVGVMHSIAGIDEVPGELKYALFLKGLREALNDAGAGLLAAALAALPATVGTWRMARREERLPDPPR